MLLCNRCDGSGEGMYDGSKCSRCRGKGEESENLDDDLDYQDTKNLED